MKIVKILGFGLVNYVVRFAVGGALFTGMKMNPEGFWFGFILTAVAFVSTLVFLKYAVKPGSIKEGFGIVFVWFIITLGLDALTAEPIVQVDVNYLFSELQVWTRSLVMFVAIPLAVRKHY